MCPHRRISDPTTGARNNPPVAMNRGATPTRAHAAVITAGSTGLM
jgi:hypothetical protein